MSSKNSRFLSSAALVTLGLVVAFFIFTRHSQVQAAPADKTSKSVTPAAQNATAAPATAPQPLPPGTISQTAKALTTAQFVAREHLTESQYMTVAEYVDAIGKANNGKTTFKKGETIFIPGIEPQ
ncbi:MAG TPA: hypothetical protein VFB79_11965, partial [Candidatus Angelobacter sp.]|nr:hypothetical protein [Candidatus Angelobacter sp.]